MKGGRFDPLRPLLRQERVEALARRSEKRAAVLALALAALAAVLLVLLGGGCRCSGRLTVTTTEAG